MSVRPVLSAQNLSGTSIYQAFGVFRPLKVKMFTKTAVFKFSYAIIQSGDFMHDRKFDDDKKYIERIRALREDNDYTQQYIADYLCTSQTMYARDERDATALPIRHLFYLAKLYDVSTDYILGLTNNPLPCDKCIKMTKSSKHPTNQQSRYSIQWKNKDK